MTAFRFPRAALGVTALGLAAAAAAFHEMPIQVVAAYFVLSVLSYLMYWEDKGAAQNGSRRTPEGRLHLVDLFGGWPGALIAQQQFRHKTLKQAFQTVFWITVLLNLVAVGWLLASGTWARLLTLIGR